MSLEREVVVHDWYPEGSEAIKRASFRLLDTTLRDGLQTPGIKQPSLEDKLKIIDYDASLGIEAIDVCLPSDPATNYFKEGVECAKYIQTNYPHIETYVLARTIESDVEATLNFAQKAGSKLNVILFRGSSDVRLLAEDWDELSIVSDMQNYTERLVKGGLNVTCATEDSTRSRPELLKDIFEAGRQGGATEFCLADTVGDADPMGIVREVRWLKEALGDKDLHVQYHGHDDSYNSVSNSMAAIVAGADTIHVTHLGIGERAGNTPIEGILSNLLKRGIKRYDTLGMVEGSRLVAKAFGMDIPVNHPLVGRNVFKTESGIHAAGIDKARKNHPELVGITYSAVNPLDVNRETEVAIGPLGGSHSVKMVLERMGFESTPQLTKELLRQARIKNQALSDDEINAVIREMNGNSH